MNNLLFALLLMMPSARAGELHALHPVQVRRFADHLFDAGRYGDALHEYRRLAYTDNGSSTTAYNEGLCLLRAEWYTEAAGRFRALAEESIDAGVSALARKAYAYTLFRQGRYDSCLAVLGTAVFAETDAGALLRTACLARQGRWRSASRAAAPLVDAAAIPVRALHDTVAALCRAGAATKRKSPFLASALSVVPGLGNMYFGRYADGFYSFLVVAGSYASAYLAYENDVDIAAYGGAGFGAVMHLGNIFGSAVVTRHVNRLRREAPADALDRLFLKYGAYGHAGIRLERF